MPSFLHANFMLQSPNHSTYEWNVLYAGYNFDDNCSLYNIRLRHLHCSLGLWCTRDPLEYVDALSLYQYCNSNPLGRTDPLGAAFVGGEDGERRFFNGLRLIIRRTGGTLAQEKIIDAMRRSKQFSGLWKCLRDSKRSFSLTVSVGAIVAQEREVFGMYDSLAMELSINSMKPEFAANPAEIVDTVVHEVIHAVIDARMREPTLKCDCPDKLLDISNDPVLFGLRGGLKKSNPRITPEQRNYLEVFYGESASSPDYYIDMHYQAQQLIAQIVYEARTSARTGAASISERMLD